jgi:hypothetical protein
VICESASHAPRRSSSYPGLVEIVDEVLNTSDFRRTIVADLRRRVGRSSEDDRFVDAGLTIPVLTAPISCCSPAAGTMISVAPHSPTHRQPRGEVRGEEAPRVKGFVHYPPTVVLADSGVSDPDSKDRIRLGGQGSVDDCTRHLSTASSSDVCLAGLLQGDGIFREGRLACRKNSSESEMGSPMFADASRT